MGASAQQAGTNRRGAIWRLLSGNADFRRLYLATIVTFLGDWFAFVAVSGFVTEVTGRPALAALVYAANVLPVFFLAPFAGAAADRWDRRRLMALVSGLQAVPALGLLVAVWLQAPWLAIGCVAVLAALSAFIEPIVGAAVPNLVRPEDLSLAQTIVGSAWATMLFVGAAVGGLTAATLGREASFLINAATFLTATVLILRVRAPMQEAVGQAHEAVLGQLAELWRYVRADRVTLSLLTSKAGVGIANGIVGLLPAFAVARFALGDGGVGLLLAARGLGSLLGPLLGHRLAAGRGNRLFAIIGLSMISYGSAYALLPLTTSLSAAALCVMLAHLGGGAQWVLSTYGLQVITPDRLRGRVLSMDFGLATLAMGLSALGAAGASELLGLDGAAWLLSAVATALGTSWLIWTAAFWRRGASPLRRPAASPLEDPVPSPGAGRSA